MQIQVHDDPFWVRLVSDPRLLSIAARYIGEDIALFASHYIAKPPGDGQPVLFHQDGSCKTLRLHDMHTCILRVGSISLSFKRQRENFSQLFSKERDMEPTERDLLSRFCDIV